MQQPSVLVVRREEGFKVPYHHIFNLIIIIDLLIIRIQKATNYVPFASVEKGLMEGSCVSIPMVRPLNSNQLEPISFLMLENLSIINPQFLAKL